jgi:hypothetical protein
MNYNKRTKRESCTDSNQSLNSNFSLTSPLLSIGADKHLHKSDAKLSKTNLRVLNDLRQQFYESQRRLFLEKLLERQRPTPADHQFARRRRRGQKHLAQVKKLLSGPIEFVSNVMMARILQVPWLADHEFDIRSFRETKGFVTDLKDVTNFKLDLKAHELLPGTLILPNGKLFTFLSYFIDIPMIRWLYRKHLQVMLREQKKIKSETRTDIHYLYMDYQNRIIDTYDFVKEMKTLKDYDDDVIRTKRFLAAAKKSNLRRRVKEVESLYEEPEAQAGDSEEPLSEQPSHETEKHSEHADVNYVDQFQQLLRMLCTKEAILAFLGTAVATYYFRGSIRRTFQKLLNRCPENPFDVLINAVKVRGVQCTTEIMDAVWKLCDAFVVLIGIKKFGIEMSPDKMGKAFRRRYENVVSWTSDNTRMLYSWPALITGIIQSVLEFFRTGWQLCFGNGCHTPDAYEKFLHDVSDLQVKFNSRDIASKHGVTSSEFLEMLAATKKQGDSMLRYNSRNAPFMRYYAMLEHLVQESERELLVTGRRIMPYGVFINGLPGCGKTTIMTELFGIIAFCFGVKFDKNHIYIRKAEKYWSGLRSYHKYIFIDDFNATFVDKDDPESSTLADVLHVQNSTIVCSNQATESDKGRIPWFNIALGLTGNNKYNGLHRMYQTIGGFTRRVHLHIQMKVKPDFDNGKGGIDVNKVKDGCEPAYFEICEISENNPNDWQCKQTLNLTELHKYVRQHCSAHVRVARAEYERMDGLTMCEQCGLPVKSCDCCFTSEDDSDEHPKDFIGDHPEAQAGVMLGIFYATIFMFCGYSMSVGASFMRLIGLFSEYQFYIFIMRIYVFFQTLYWHFKPNFDIAVAILRLKASIIERQLKRKASYYKPKWIDEHGKDVLIALSFLTLGASLFHQWHFRQNPPDWVYNMPNPPQWVKDKKKERDEELAQAQVGSSDYWEGKASIIRTKQSASWAKTDNLRNRVLENLYRVCFTGQRKDIHVLFLKGNLFITAYEFQNHLDNEKGKVILQNPRHDGCKIQNIYEYSPQEFQLVCKLRNVLGVYTIPIRPHKSLVEFFPLERVKGMMHSEVICVHTNRPRDMLRKRVTTYPRQPPLIDGSGVEGTDFPLMTTYSMPGACGTPYFSCESGVIFGIHYAGFKQLGQGIAASLTQEDLSMLPKVFVPATTKVNPRTISPLSPKSFANFIDGQGHVEGTICPKRSYPRTRVHPTAIKDEMEDLFGVKYDAPIFTRNPDDPFSDPVHMNVTALTKPKSFDTTYLKRAINSYKQKAFAGILKQQLQPLTIDEAINGIPGHPWIHSMKMDSSTGYPLFIKKSEYLIQQGDRWVPNDELRSQVEQLIDMYENYMLEGPIYKMTLKDEAREATKIRLRKLRAFTGQPLVAAIVTRMYFLPLMDFLYGPGYTRFKKSECAKGVNPFSEMWRHFYHYLTYQGRDRLFFGDYKSFDKNIDPRLLMGAFSVFEDIAEQSGYTPCQLRVLHAIAIDTCYACYLVNGDIVIIFGGLVSGHGITTELNCICNSTLGRMAFYRAGYSDFNNNVRMIVYGDDSIMCIRRGCNFTMMDLALHLKAFNQEYTSADKSAVDVAYQTIDEGEFLGRSFVETDEGVVLCPLNLKSIGKRLMWTDSEMDPDEHLWVVLESAIAELSLHDQAVWDKFYPVLFDKYIHYCEIMQEKPRHWSKQMWQSVVMGRATKDVILDYEAVAQVGDTEDVSYAQTVLEYIICVNILFSILFSLYTQNPNAFILQIAVIVIAYLLQYPEAQSGISEFEFYISEDDACEIPIPYMSDLREALDDMSVCSDDSTSTVFDLSEFEQSLSALNRYMPVLEDNWAERFDAAGLGGTVSLAYIDITMSNMYCDLHMEEYAPAVPFGIPFDCSILCEVLDNHMDNYMATRNEPSVGPWVIHELVRGTIREYVLSRNRRRAASYAPRVSSPLRNVQSVLEEIPEVNEENEENNDSISIPSTVELDDDDFPIIPLARPYDFSL